MNERPLKKSSRIPLRECRSAEARRIMLRAHGLDGHLPGFRMADDAADAMIENAVGSFHAPLGVATNFVVNGEERLVAMATEERSVVAAASYAAKLCRQTGGFSVEVGENVATGQIFYGPSAWRSARMSAREALVDVNRRSAELVAKLAASNDPARKHGGGLRGIAAVRPDLQGEMLVISVRVDVADAMGANVVTRMGESLATILEPAFGVRPTAVICTNEAQGPSIAAKAGWTAAPGEEKIFARVAELQAWAEADKSRAVTHNKGIMNGVSAVALATGQDVRAIEAAAHAAATDEMPQYGPLTSWEWHPEDRTLEGELRFRVPLGVVGGATAHPTAVWARTLMGVENVRDLAAIIGAVGLAQNFAALRSLADEGIPGAHARLRKR